MTIGTGIILLIVSFFGVILWVAMLGLSANIRNARKDVGIELPKRTLAGFLFYLAAATVTFAPLFIIIWKAALA